MTDDRQAKRDALAEAMKNATVRVYPETKDES